VPNRPLIANSNSRACPKAKAQKAISCLNSV
jgi:hypothetical protein